jgi:urease accessory protein
MIFMVIKIDNEDISILQLADSFFPTGLYATSNGLEALSKEKKLTSKDISKFIATYLIQVIGPSDCTALGNAYELFKKRDIDSVIQTDKLIYHMKLIEETRTASVRSGNQLLKCVISFSKDKKMLKEYKNAIANGKATGIYPVSFGVVTASLKIAKKKAGLIYLYGFTVSIVGAALRLGIIQHFEGQKLIHDLGPVMLQTVQENIERPIVNMWHFAPGLDILQMKHEVMTSKMFIT